MAKNKKRDTIPENFETLEAFWDFWDRHSLADYKDKLREIEVEVDLQDEETETIVLDKGIAEQVGKIAAQQGISKATLVNLWLKEKLETPVLS
jgi:hypothetical protein